MPTRRTRLACEAFEDRITPVTPDGGPLNLRGVEGAFRITQTSAPAGGTVGVRFAVENPGTVGTAGPFRITFYLSPDALINTADQPIGVTQVAALGPASETAGLTRTFAIPAFVAPGTYTLGMIIDPDNRADEGDELDNSNRGPGIDSAVLTVVSGSGGKPPVVPLTGPGGRYFAVGPDAGVGPAVQVFDAVTRATVQQAGVFDSVFTGGVRTAVADVNNDGVADVVVGTGPGRATQVRVLDGRDQNALFTLDPFEAAFTGGVFVAAGDVTGDGFADVVITPDEGGGPRVRVLSGAGFAQVADFFGIEDPNFRGGARAAVGDINADGTGDLVVAAGFQGGPRVAAFNGTSLATGPVKLFGDFFAFEQTLRNGVFVAVGDVTGDGFAELIAGGGPGGGPRVTAFSGKALLANQLEVAANFFAGDSGNRDGIRLAVKDVDGDGRADLVTAGGAPGGRVTAYRGRDFSPTETPPAAYELTAGDLPGAFVG